MKEKRDNIYIYLWEEFNTIYIGRTVNPKGRHYAHKHRESEKTYQFSSEHHVEHPKMIIIENDLSVEDGVEREKYWIDYYKNNTSYNILNKTCGGQIGELSILSEEERKARKKAYNEAHKEERKAYYREYYRKRNAYKILLKAQKKVERKILKAEKMIGRQIYKEIYYERNKEKVKKWTKSYRDKHSEEIKEKRKIYREIHREEIRNYERLRSEKRKEYQHKYYEAHKEERKKYMEEYRSGKK